MDTSIFWTLLCGVISITVAVGSILLTRNRSQSSESTTAEPVINPFESPTVTDALDSEAIASLRSPPKRSGGWVIPTSIILGAFMLGVIAPIIRPYTEYNGTHVEALVSLLLLFVASISLVIHNRRIARLAGHLRFQLENVTLWAAFVCGWILIERYAWGNLVSVMGAWALSCGFLGSLLLAITPWFRRPTAAESSA